MDSLSKIQVGRYHSICDICLESGLIVDILGTFPNYEEAEFYLKNNAAIKEYYGDFDEIKERYLKYPKYGEDHHFLLKVKRDISRIIGIAMIIQR